MYETEVIEILKQNETFSTAGEAVLLKLVSTGEGKDFAANEDIVVQGVTGKTIWVLIEGDLVILADGKEVNRVSGEGMIFGEISAVSFTPATATVRTAAPARAMGFSHQSLHRAMEQSPALAEALLRSMAKYLDAG